MNIQELKIWIQNTNVSEYTFVFDLDGTLVNSDLANKHAYFKAAAELGIHLFEPKGRFTRASLRYSYLDTTTEKQIIGRKEDLFAVYLDEVELLPAADVLSVLPQDANVLLVTRCSRRRAMEVINSFGWAHRFSAMYFAEDLMTGQKVDFVLRNTMADASHLIWVEDDELELQVLRNMNVSVVPVLRSFVVYKNNYLKKHQLAFCHDNYVPGEWTYINVLKNDSLNKSASQLDSARNTLRSILLEDIPVLYRLLRQKELVVMPIPRSKSLSSYQDSQLQLAHTIIDVTKELSGGINLINGGGYMVRHSDTPTTHLGELLEDGNKTYPGITSQTCTISPKVSGKDILLIDDIYTPFVGIDEDAIQALYDAGANKVTLYTLGKTTH